MPSSLSLLQDALRPLKNLANEADLKREWPEKSWETLRAARVLSWCVPKEHGGGGLGGVEILRGYEQLARTCLTTSFILSQRDAACRRIRDSGNAELCGHLLPRL